jgi:hypothetical protein
MLAYRLLWCPVTKPWFGVALQAFISVNTLQVSEAEAMVAGGIQDVFISNEVVAPQKITRMVALAAQGRQRLAGHSLM